MLWVFGWLARFCIDWVIYNGGITSEDRYPYKGVQGCCQVKKSVKHITDYRSVPSGSIHSLKTIVSRQPVTARLSVGLGFMSLKVGAVYKGNFEDQFLGLHAVLIVGYDTSPDGT